MSDERGSDQTTRVHLSREYPPDDPIGSNDPSCSSNTPGGDTRKVPWPHAPTHRLGGSGTFMVTAGTYRKQHFFRGEEKTAHLHDELLRFAERFGWRLEAWAVFSNHYHYVGHSPPGADGAESLREMAGQLHETTAKWVNALDGTPVRTVWHNFCETRLTYEKSYFARLHYTHDNPVHHGLAPVSNHYPWCSASWFEQTATPAQVKTIYSFKIDRLRVYDDYEAG